MTGFGGWLIKTDSNGDEEWSEDYGSFNIYSVDETSDGGFILAGSEGALIKTDELGDLSWEKDFDAIDIHWVEQASDGGYILAGFVGPLGSWDGLLIKTDSDGDKEWSRILDGYGNDLFYAVDPTSDGGYIAGGFTGSNGTDFWLVKTDFDGVGEWIKTFGGSGREEARYVQETSDGGYILAGYTTSSKSGYVGWLVKTDSSGNEEWSQTYGSSGSNLIYSAQQTSDGGFILAGGYNFWVVKLVQDDDEDDDGVLNEHDKCPGTVLPDEPGKLTLFFHYSDIDGDGIFETEGKPKLINGIWTRTIKDSQFTLEKTYGCSCTQILELKPDELESNEEPFYGCTYDTMMKFIRQNGWAKKLF